MIWSQPKIPTWCEEERSGAVALQAGRISLPLVFLFFCFKPTKCLPDGFLLHFVLFQPHKRQTRKTTIWHLMPYFMGAIFSVLIRHYILYSCTLKATALTHAATIPLYINNVTLLYFLSSYSIIIAARKWWAKKRRNFNESKFNFEVCFWESA